MTREARKERMVGSRLPADMVHDLEEIERVEQTDRSTTVRKLLARAVNDWKLEHAGSRYAEGRLSLGRAAEEAGVTIWEMMDYLRRHKISASYGLDDLKHDIEIVRDNPS